MPFYRKEKTEQTTTNAYVDMLKEKITDLPKCSVVLSCTVNAIKYKVLVSNDVEGVDATFAEDKAETAIDSGGTGLHVVTGAFQWVKVQVKSSVDDAHGTANCWLHAARD